MEIYLGNLSVEKIEKEYKVKFTEEDKSWLNLHRQEDVNNCEMEKDTWHMFDIPRIMVVDSYEFATELFNKLKNYEFDGPFKICIG